MSAGHASPQVIPTEMANINPCLVCFGRLRYYARFRLADVTSLMASIHSPFDAQQEMGLIGVELARFCNLYRLVLMAQLPYWEGVADVDLPADILRQPRLLACLGLESNTPCQSEHCWPEATFDYEHGYHGLLFGNAEGLRVDRFGDTYHTTPEVLCDHDSEYGCAECASFDVLPIRSNADTDTDKDSDLEMGMKTEDQFEQQVFPTDEDPWADFDFDYRNLEPNDEWGSDRSTRLDCSVPGRTCHLESDDGGHSASEDDDHAVGGVTPTSCSFITDEPDSYDDEEPHV